MSHDFFSILRLTAPHEISGTLITTDLDTGLETHEPTIQCCHCGGHWTPRPGSGRVRGYCGRCQRKTCGRPGCDLCVPYEQRLENIEAGRPEETPGAVKILVPGDVPSG